MELNNFVFKKKWQKLVYRIIACLLGSFCLAFANAVFLTPASIVAGGVTGIGVVIAHYCPVNYQPYVVDCTVLILNIIFFILAIIFLNKRFVIQTLIATFAVPFFMAMIQSTGMFDFISKTFTPDDHGSLLLAGILGGLFVGLGCTITFFGDGSTGGTDVLSFILNKFFGVKQSIVSFTWDTTVIVIGLICFRSNVFSCLVGALSVLLSALVIDFLYVSSVSGYVVDIISDKYLEINQFIIDELDRTTSIIDIIGGYSKENKKMVRFVLDKREFSSLKEQISIIDPKAFVTVYRAKKVLGEGFSNLRAKKARVSLFNKKKKDDK